MPVAVHAHTNADFRGGVQPADDGEKPRPLFISVISPAPESAHIAVGVQLAEGVGITVAGSHDGDAGSPLDRPAQLDRVTMVQELVERLVSPFSGRPPSGRRTLRASVSAALSSFSGIRATLRRNVGRSGARPRTEQATTGTMAEKNDVSALTKMLSPAKMY